MVAANPTREQLIKNIALAAEKKLSAIHDVYAWPDSVPPAAGA